MSQPSSQEEPTAPLLKRLQKYQVYVLLAISLLREHQTNRTLSTSTLTNDKLTDDNRRLVTEVEDWKSKSIESDKRYIRLTDRLYPKNDPKPLDSAVVPATIPAD